MDTTLLADALIPQLQEAERLYTLHQDALALLKLSQQEVMFTVIVRHHQGGHRQEKFRLTGKNLSELLEQLTGKIKMESAAGGFSYDDDEVLVCMHSPKFPETFILLNDSWVDMHHPEIDSTTRPAIPSTWTKAYDSLEALTADPEVANPGPS